MTHINVAKADGAVSVTGHERRPAKFVKFKNGQLVVYNFPSSVWTGIGQPHTYMPAEYQIHQAKKVAEGDTHDTYLVENYFASLDFLARGPHTHK